MTEVVRLRTVVDVDAAGSSHRNLSATARHEAVLDDGRRVLLLDDRGWGASGPPGIWAATSVADIEDTARMVVGPDEPSAGHTATDMAADHWAHLAALLHRSGVTVDADRLARLPHDVVLSDRLRARLRAGPANSR
ncbi:hypothetical protein Athai_12250 [Actinocatenispora thailandica]|uniref:Uncharacterized protein n=1 Tax=Actinocatenispora thailandica TaxID=227318 RepID=A0A7R7DLT0_9ACTN|nr:hypothetical protein [Actinocatenispora thailandica]BCJ33722.1 hypothetical protein Athai_12250 [Actinocatenispora thailandica]